MQKLVLFSEPFEPPEELDKLAKELGYNSKDYYTNFDFMFDERVVKFVEEHLTRFRENMVYKG